MIKSPNGDVTLKNPPTVQADKLEEKFDVILLSCKAFDLDDAIRSFAAAVGPQTTIIPMLNGMLHLDVLDEKFGRERVLGGLCAIAVTLNEGARSSSSLPMQSLNFGERDGRMSDRVRAIAEVMASGNFGSVASEHIVQEMWEKWVFLASLAASTSLMRARSAISWLHPAARISCSASSMNAAPSPPPRVIRRACRFWSGRAAC